LRQRLTLSRRRAVCPAFVFTAHSDAAAAIWFCLSFSPPSSIRPLRLRQFCRQR
jgi:hypothetical protein